MHGRSLVFTHAGGNSRPGGGGGVQVFRPKITIFKKILHVKKQKNLLTKTKLECWGCSPSSPSAGYRPALGLKFSAGAAISSAGAVAPVAPALATGLFICIM